MQPIQLFRLASQQAHWLSVRQDVVAGNVANANTPGYKAMDVEPFSQVLDRMQSNQPMAADNPAHFVTDSLRDAVRTGEHDDGIAIKPSGNSVSLAEELIKTGDIRRDFELNTALVKSFHQMMMMVSRP
ncbi:MAG TPA: flagellar basal body rod protein FlgB [Pararhizobium sp.]|nr:flagellar basal body rod protein FlgB [Pararhizobium sp.]